MDCQGFGRLDASISDGGRYGQGHRVPQRQALSLLLDWQLSEVNTSKIGDRYRGDKKDLAKENDRENNFGPAALIVGLHLPRGVPIGAGRSEPNNMFDCKNVFC